MTVVIVVVVVWLTGATMLAFTMSRRGHDPFVWWTLGAMLGPLAAPLAVAHRSRSASPLLAPDRDETGSVLVAIRPDGDHRDLDQTLFALAAVSGPLRVTLATVLDADAPTTQHGAESIEHANRHLSEIAERLVTQGLLIPPVARRVLFGDPAVVLVEHARDFRFSLLLLGVASSRWRRFVHGSTRHRLSRRGDVPVLIAANRPQEGADEPDRPT